jgi:hypothetical protein
MTRPASSGLEGQQAPAAQTIQIELGTSANIEAILSPDRLLQQALRTTTVNGLSGVLDTVSLPRQLALLSIESWIPLSSALTG